jgi:hypothetical protein
VKIICSILALAAFSALSAQTDPKSTMPERPAGNTPDSVSSNRQLQKQSDMKTMDAVKTQDHPKITRRKTTHAKSRVRKDTLRSTKATRSNP